MLTKSRSINFPSTHSVSSLFLHHEDALDTLDNEISWQQISHVRVRGGSVNLKLPPFSCIHVLFAIANKWPQTIMKQNSTIEGRVLPKWTSQYGSLSIMWDSCFYPLPVQTSSFRSNDPLVHFCVLQDRKDIHPKQPLPEFIVAANSG